MAAPTKVALVTASSAGLGAAVAHALAPYYRVAINYNSSPAKAQAVLDSLHKSVGTTAAGEGQQQQPRFQSFKCNLGDRADVERLVKDVATQMGGIDVLVSNGGWTEVRGFTDLDANSLESDWDGCWNMNVKSHLWLLHAARKHLEASVDGGGFITVASTAGVKPSGSSLVSSYCFRLLAIHSPSGR
jgi:NAD(P)-dependent dehydrogenase (short-subunit alcohol dehydrogenase family)